MTLEKFKSEVLENSEEPIRTYVLDFATSFFAGKLEIPDNKKEIPDWVKEIEKSSGICMTDIRMQRELTTQTGTPLILKYTLNLKRTDILWLSVEDLSDFSTLNFDIVKKLDTDKINEEEIIVQGSSKDIYLSFKGKYTNPPQIDTVNECGELDTLINFLNGDEKDTDSTIFINRPEIND